MKILLVTRHLDPGGITTYLRVLSRGLKRLGHEVAIASSSKATVKGFEDDGTEVLLVPIRTKCEVGLRSFMSAVGIARLVKKHGFDVIHAQNRVAQVSGAIASWMTGVPVVTTCHGFIRKSFSRRVLPCWGERIIAVSPEVRDYIMGQFPEVSGKLEMIYNGVDPEMFDDKGREAAAEDIRKRHGWGPEVRVIGSVGRLSPVRGHALLLQSFRKVVDKRSDVRLLIVGDGEEKSNLVKAAGSLGIDDHVAFIHSTEDIRDVLCAMDIYASPAIEEGFGYSIVEAMSCGLPVVAFGAGAVSSVLTDGVTGVLVAVGDIPVLGKELLGLAEDAGRAESLGLAAREYAREHFSGENMARATGLVYRECVRG